MVEQLKRKILIMGLPGAGKTTLAKALASRLSAVHWNADDVRAHISKDLGFSELDRIEQAARMGWLCDRVVAAGHYAIADFVCPTEATREAFLDGGEAFVIWVDRIDRGRFEDTNRLFERPNQFHVRVVAAGSAAEWADHVLTLLHLGLAPASDLPTA